MHQIEAYDFPENIDNNLNLFPNDIITGDVIYFGTCELYFDSFSQKGFVREHTAIPTDTLRNFVNLLDESGMGDGNGERSPKKRISDYLRDKPTAPFNFAFSPYQALFYATGNIKGGQIFTAIIKGIRWLESNNINLDEHQSILVDNLNLKYNAILASAGSVYAIRVSEDILPNLHCELAKNIIPTGFLLPRFYGREIPVRNIIGRVILGPNFVCNQDIIHRFNEQNINNSYNDEGSLIYKLCNK